MAEQEAVVTSAEPNATFPVENGTDCPAYVSPEGKDSQMGVIVLQEWWGMNKSIQATTDIFGGQGFRALVPDLYRGKVAKDSEHAGHLMQGLNWGGAIKDIQAAARYLKKEGCKKVGGFCMGGALTIVSSTLPEVDAGVCFYGVPDLSTLDLKSIKIPIQAHFGNSDTMKGFSDPEAADRLEKTLKEAGVSIELHRYDNAGHAFTNKNRPNHYNEEVAKKAFEATWAFFKKNLA